MFGKVGPKECTSLLEVFNDVHIKVRHGGQSRCKIVIFGDLGFQWKMKPEHVIFRGAYSVFRKNVPNV